MVCREFFGQGWMKLEKNERTPYIMKNTKHFNDVGAAAGHRGMGTGEAAQPQGLGCMRVTCPMSLTCLGDPVQVEHLLVQLLLLGLLQHREI